MTTLLNLAAITAAGLVIGAYAYLEGPALAWLARVVERRRGGAR